MRTIVRNIPTEIIKRYADFDRSKERRLNSLLNVYGIVTIQSPKDLEKDILENGIKAPLRLFIVKGKAILGEGNHRLDIAFRNRIKSVPVSIEFPQINEIEYEFCLNRGAKMKKFTDYLILTK
jgi:hypothetical protein